MLPNIWIFDSYTIMVFLGIILCFAFLFIVQKKKKRFTEGEFYSILIAACFSIVGGLIFAVLFQNLYFLIENKENYHFSLSMTFYGGLIGGVTIFLLLYFIYYRKKYGPYLLDKILPVASFMICIAHGVGRIGCFLSGCCYGKETTSIIGVQFVGMDHKVVPINLFEAIFLISLAITFLILSLKDKDKYNFQFYLILYGLWRFIIEFYRGDDRGKFIGELSPSQFWSIIIFIIGIVLFIYERKRVYGKNKRS